MASKQVRYSKAIAEKICDRISLGESVRSICKDDDMPNRETVFYWLRNDKHDFPDQYARARNHSTEAFADEILHLATDDDMFDVNATKLKIDTLKWIAGKQRPMKYGDRVKATLPNVNFKLDESDTPTNQVMQILKESSKGGISPDVAFAFMNAVKTATDIEQNTDLKKRIEELENMMNG